MVRMEFLVKTLSGGMSDGAFIVNINMIMK